ncbi:prepilin peptidase [Amycolatopsis nigrescens]|uniref:prepilin peptidase n=1 Tax=Amycolatopsis nigrescens TaxID=381445 RepID=UPI00037C78FA|nr:A24 family peptidase [Amycolatopsis nigrescens]
MDIVTLLAVAGCLTGLLGCLVLRRSRRPAPVHPGCCAAGVGLLWAGTGWRWFSGGLPPWWLPVPLVVTALAVPLALADLRYRRLPDVLTLPAYPLVALAVAAVVLTGPEQGAGPRAALGCLVFAGVHLVVRMLSPASLGAGDVKLAGALGAVLGAVGWAALVLAAAGAALGTALLAFVRRPGWRDGVPYGPGLLAAACLVAIFPAAGSLEVGMGN